MKELISRKVDKLGRIVLPKELRDNMQITHETPLEIFVDKNIMIHKYESTDDKSLAAFLRNVDRLGRIVIPKEIRDEHNIACGNRLKIFIDEDYIIIKKEDCIFCAAENNLTEVLGRNVCADCLNKIKEEF